MTITAIANHVMTNGAVLIRARECGQYDMKELFTGNKRGWTIIDLQTANVLLTVRNALNESNKAKFDLIPLRKLVDFCWKQVQ